jgi:hypothetical protein
MHLLAMAIARSVVLALIPTNGTTAALLVAWLWLHLRCELVLDRTNLILIDSGRQKSAGYHVSA